jgi:hypothetical protein
MLGAVLKRSSCSTFAIDRRKATNNVSRMHNILETSIESRCNEAIAPVDSIELWDSPGKAADGRHRVLFCALCEANTARHSIDRLGPTSVVRDTTAGDGGQSRYGCGARGQYRPVTSNNWCNGRDLHVVVRMNFPVTYLPADALEHRFDMCVEIPLVDPCERGDG